MPHGVNGLDMNAGGGFRHDAAHRGMRLDLRLALERQLLASRPHQRHGRVVAGRLDRRDQRPIRDRHRRVVQLRRAARSPSLRVRRAWNSGPWMGSLHMISASSRSSL